LDGRTLKSRRKLYIALHKPRGFLCTRSDPQKRRTLAGLLPKEWDNLYPVGRLDHDSEGLIFLTNDGEFCLKLTHPRYAVPKTYAVTVAGRLERRILGRLTGGVLDAGQLLKANQARLLVAGSSHSVVELVLTEGKNREIRRMFAGLGLEISRLQRTRIGPIKLGELPPGKWRTLTEPEIKSLLSGL
jgi:23S rRNA pseudouridine2605 synthase